MPIVIAALLLLMPAATPGVQTAADLVAKHIAARGGADRLKAITSMRVTRTVGTPFANVKVVMLRQRPNLLRIEQTPPGRPTTARIVTAGGAWDETPQGWTARPAAVAAEALDIDADFDGFLVDYAQKGHRVDYAGMENVGGKPAHHLIVTLRSGAERHVYLDPGAFLERRQTGMFILPNNTKVSVVLDFSDWREIAGVKFPFAIDEDRDAMGQTYAVYVDSIDVNVPLDPALFAPPTAAGK
jgi:hypothetical protein